MRQPAPATARARRSAGYLLHRHVLIPAFESRLKRRRTLPLWGELERTQWLDRNEIARLQLDAVRRLLRYAFKWCPYYRECWQALGLDPAGLRSLADLARWPILNRGVIHAERQRLRSRVPGLRLLSKSTSGSTAAPLIIDYDTGSLERRMAAWHRGYAWAGAEPGAKQFYFWGVPVRPTTRAARAKDALYHWLYRRHVVSCLHFDEALAHSTLREYERVRPDTIVAYAGPLYELARVFQEQSLRPTPPRSIVVGAEGLQDFQRAMIQEVFRAPVFETYGCREFMLIAAECDRHRGLHLTAEHLFVEIVDEDGRAVPSGQEGRVIVTDLHNYGLPFIRYDLGDRAVATTDACPCGRGLPLLQRVGGRRMDAITTPDGRLVAGALLVLVFNDAPEVKRYQVVQDTHDRLDVFVELRTAWPEASREEAMVAIQRAVGPRMVVALHVVEKIPLTAGGKLLAVVNNWRTRELQDPSESEAAASRA